MRGKIYFLFSCFLVCLFAGYSSLAVAESINVKGHNIEIVPVHGLPFIVDTISLNDSDVLQFVTKEGKEGFIGKGNIKNLNEVTFMTKSVKAGLDFKDVAKSRSLGREVDSLGREITQVQKDTDDQIARMKIQAKNK